jgi:hypothetical protein
VTSKNCGYEVKQEFVGGAGSVNITSLSSERLESIKKKNCIDSMKEIGLAVTVA